MKPDHEHEPTEWTFCAQYRASVRRLVRALDEAPIIEQRRHEMRVIALHLTTEQRERIHTEVIDAHTAHDEEESDD